MKYLVAVVVAVVLAAAIVGSRVFSDGGEPVSILFVGNSCTTSNDLPSVVASMGSAGDYDVDVGVVAAGGAWLRDHVVGGVVRSSLAGGDWDYVVLQEQSIVPASPTERAQAMFPAVREIAGIAEDSDTETVLFLTWAGRDGFPDVGYNSYGPMQRAITAAYEEIAAEVGAIVAPVGEAWSAAAPSYDLYTADGSHPSPAGTYLAAATVYATLFGENSQELDFDGSLDSAAARGLRSIAGRVVLGDAARWGVTIGPGAG